jgi:hypothetical protein
MRWPPFVDLRIKGSCEGHSLERSRQFPEFVFVLRGLHNVRIFLSPDDAVPKDHRIVNLQRRYVISGVGTGTIAQRHQTNTLEHTPSYAQAHVTVFIVTHPLSVRILGLKVYKQLLRVPVEEGPQVCRPYNPRRPER